MSSIQSLQEYKSKKGNMVFHSIPLAEGNYTTVQNSVWFNPNLKDKTVRVFGYILSHRFNPGWKLNSFAIAEIFECDEKTIIRVYEELKREGYLKITRTGMNGNTPTYEYEIFEQPLSLEERQVADKGNGQRYQTKVTDKNVLYNNKVSNKEKKKVSKEEKQTDQLLEIDNVENSLIQFADKADEEKIKTEFDKLLDGRLQILPNSIDELKLQAAKLKKIKPLSEILEIIRLLPEYVEASKIKNPEKKYEDKKALTYLEIILSKTSGNYPNWFLDSKKQTEVKLISNEVESNWSDIWSAWGAIAPTIDKKHELFIKNLISQTTETAKIKNNPERLENKGHKNRAERTVKAVKVTLETKTIDDIFNVVRELVQKAHIQMDSSFKDIFNNDFVNIENTLESIKENILFTSNLEVK